MSDPSSSQHRRQGVENPISKAHEAPPEEQSNVSNTDKVCISGFVAGQDRDLSTLIATDPLKLLPLLPLLSGQAFFLNTISTLITLGKLKEAEQLLDSLKSKSPDPSTWVHYMYLLARMEFVQARTAECLRILRQLLRHETSSSSAPKPSISDEELNSQLQKWELCIKYLQDECSRIESNRQHSSPRTTPATSPTTSSVGSSKIGSDSDSSTIPSLRPLARRSKEYEECENEFLRALPESNLYRYVVKAIAEVTNDLFSDEFFQSILLFDQNAWNEDPTQPELSVYHGAQPQQVKHLVEHNWPPPRTAGSDEWSGAGMYFSINPEYVMKFALPNGRNGCVEIGDQLKVIQYSILPGKSMRLSSLKSCRGSIPNYQSVKSKSGNEILMFDSKHILPKYVLDIEVQSAETQQEGAAEGSTSAASGSFVDSMTRPAVTKEPTTNDNVSPMAVLQSEGSDLPLTEFKNTPDISTEAALTGLLSHADSLGERGKYREQEHMLNEALVATAKIYGNHHPRLADVLDRLADVYSTGKLDAPAEYAKFTTAAQVIRKLAVTAPAMSFATIDATEATLTDANTIDTGYVDPASMPEQVIQVRAAVVSPSKLDALPNETSDRTSRMSTDGVVTKGIDLSNVRNVTSSPEGLKNDSGEQDATMKQDSSPLRSAFDEWIRTVTSSSTPASRVFWLKARSPVAANDRSILGMLNNEHQSQSVVFHKCAVNGRSPSDVIRTTLSSLVSQSKEHRQHVLGLISPDPHKFDNYTLADEPTVERSAKQLIFVDLADDLTAVGTPAASPVIMTLRDPSTGSAYEIVVTSLQSGSGADEKEILRLEHRRIEEHGTERRCEFVESREIARFPIVRPTGTSGASSTLLHFIKTALIKTAQLSLFPPSIAVVIQSSHPPPDFMRSMLPYVFDYDKSDAKKNASETQSTSVALEPDTDIASKPVDSDIAVLHKTVEVQPAIQQPVELPSTSIPVENISKPSLPEVPPRSGKERVIGYFTGWATHTTQKNSLGFVKRYNPEIRDFQKFVFHESRVECDKNDLQYHTMVDFELYRNPEQKVFAQAVRVVPPEKRKEYESKMDEEEQTKINTQKPAQPMPQQFAAQESKAVEPASMGVATSSGSGSDSATSSGSAPPPPVDVFFGEISQWLGSSWARIKYTPSEQDAAGWNIYNKNAPKDKFVEVEVHKNALVMRGDHKNMPKQDVYKPGVYVDFVYRESVGKYAQKVRFMSATVPDDTSHNHSAAASTSSSSSSSSSSGTSSSSSSSSGSSSSAGFKGPVLPQGMVAKGLSQSDSGLGGNSSSIPVGTQIGVFFAWSSSSNMHGTIRFSKDAFSSPSTTASAPLHPKGAYDSILFHKNRLLCADGELKAGTVVTFDCFPSSKRQGEYFAQNVALCTNKQQLENSVIVYLTEAAVKSAKIHHAFFKDWLSGTWGKLLPFEPVSSSMPSSSSIPAMPIIDMNHSIDFRSTAILGSVSDFVKEVEVEYRIFPLQGPYPQQVRVVPPEHSYWTQKALEKARARK